MSSVYSPSSLLHHTSVPQKFKRRHPLYPFSQDHIIPLPGPRRRYSSEMSSVTPISFVDDGESFRKRMPHDLRLAHVADWINSTESDVTTTYTGSFVDDGADMFPPSKHAPGFGDVDPRFYKQRKREEQEEQAAWNDDVEKAIAGDIQRSLERVKGIGQLQIKKADDTMKKNKHEKRKDMITVPLPLKWGTFIIKTDDGRVIIVDKDGEYDSGPTVSNPTPNQHTRWVKAPTTIDLLSLPPSPQHTSEGSNDQKEEKRRRQRLHSNKMKQRDLLLLTKALPTIPESVSEYNDVHQPSTGENIVSPTCFFMTGSTEWPSQSAASVTSVASRVKPKRSNQKPSPASSVASRPHVHSPPGSWLSPPHSPTKLTTISESSTGIEGSNHSSIEKESHGSRRSKKSHRSSRHGNDNVSTKTHSTYKAPTVEDADTSSENTRKSKGSEWGINFQENTSGRDMSNSDDKWANHNKNLRYSSKPMNKVTWAGDEAASDYQYDRSVQNWVGDRVKTISEASSRRSKVHRSRTASHEPLASSARTSKASWDGYERPKMLSEVSVAGMSERSWPESVTTSTRSGKTRSKHSYRSRHGSQAWEGSEEDWGASQNASVGGWTGEKTESASEGDWNGGKRGGMSPRHVHAFDEGEYAYQKEDSDAVSVRVRSARQRDDGWL